MRLGVGGRFLRRRNRWVFKGGFVEQGEEEWEGDFFRFTIDVKKYIHQPEFSSHLNGQL